MTIGRSPASPAQFGAARPYRGPDRRATVEPGEHRRLSLILLVISLVGLLAWSALLYAGRNNPAGSGSQLTVLARSLGAALFLAAGGLRLATWRLTGQAQPAWHSVGLVLIGVALSFVSVLGILDVGNSWMAPVPGRQFLLLTAVGILLFGAFSAPIQGALRPVRMMVLVLICSLTLALVIAYHSADRLPADLMVDLSRAAEWAVIGLWLVLAVRHLVRGRRATRITEEWAALGFAVMAVAETLRATGLFAHQSWTYAAGVQLIAAMLFMAAAATRLWELLSASGDRTLRLSGDLEVVRTNLVGLEQHQRERLHDARTAVVSVLGASQLLSRPEPGSGIDPARLHRMMTAELHRLGAVLDPYQQPMSDAFDLAEVLEPLVLAHRIAGAEVSVDLQSTAVIGRSAAFGTAVANVMANARTHAAGSPIEIRSQRSGDTVVLTVRDRGPGIAAAEQSRVLERGIRGSDAAGEGSGIGLYSATAAMRLQGGSLDLGTAAGGGTVVTFTLPAAPALAPATATPAIPMTPAGPRPTVPLDRTVVA